MQQYSFRILIFLTMALYSWLLTYLLTLKSKFKQFTYEQKWANLRLICTSERQNCFWSPPDQVQPVLCCWHLNALSLSPEVDQFCGSCAGYQFDRIDFKIAVLVYKALHSQLPQYLAEDSWPTLAADHCDPLMSWRVPQREHVRISETGVFPSLDSLSGTLYLSHYVTETSHLNSLRDFWRHFGLCRAVAHSDWCFFEPCINILTYLLT